MSFFDVAKQSKAMLESVLAFADKALKAFDSYGKTEMGLTPDFVRAMPEWQQAKKEFDKAFAELRAFNGWYVKTFKKEIAADRKNKYKSLDGSFSQCNNLATQQTEKRQGR